IKYMAGQKELKAKVFPRIWAKTTVGDKITRDYMYTLDGPFDESRLFEYVCDITHALDIPTPVILKNHLYNFVHFNICKFLATEFVDEVDFDFLTLENTTGTIKPLPRYFNEYD
ncbi:MAG: hypothetical protein K2M48_05770, partial [Clostridiales bacterium]|nr:hypothetical protein [Clostridiales bacterium]